MPGSGRSSGGGYDNPLQHSCLENPTDRRAWCTTVHGVTKSQTWLSMYTTCISERQKLYRDMLSQVFNRKVYERIRLKNIIRCLYFHPELHAARRTEEHRCPSGRILGNANTKNMQIPSTFEGTLCVFFIVAFLLYLYIFADDLFKNKNFLLNSLTF